MKRELRLKIVIVLLLLALSANAVFAWYENNLEVTATSESSIKIAGSGSLQVGFAYDANGKALDPQEASYSQTITMNLQSTGYDDLTGDGINIYSPAFEPTGDMVLDTSFWKCESEDDEGADNAGVTSDKGKYVLLDLYLKSDVKMDIYLNGDSSISPKKGAGDKLNSVGDDGSKTKFSQFSEGLPSLNVNQSSYGLFSRNYIAGATRVSFTNYTMTYEDSTTSYELNKVPDLVWVPNSEYHLTVSSDIEYLDTFKPNDKANKESYYSFYLVDGETITKYQVLRDSSKKIIGLLVRDGTDTYLENTLVVDDELIPAIAYSVGGGKIKVPAIHSGTSYLPAGLFDGDSKYYKAEYNSSKSSFAFVVGVKKAIVEYDETNEEYKFYEATLDGDSWVKVTDGTIWDEADALALMTGDDSTYHVVPWMEDDFVDVENSSNTKSAVAIASTTFSYRDTGPYYARVKILVWIEGTDREADIALNGGEINLDLLFFGENRDE